MIYFQYAIPVMAAASPAVVWIVALRFGPDALLRLLAGTVVALTRDEERGARCLEMMRILSTRHWSGSTERSPGRQSTDVHGSRTG